MLKSYACDRKGLKGKQNDNKCLCEVKGMVD